MKKIKVNLLGKKKAQVPFGLDEKLQKLGFRPEDMETLRPGFVKFVAALVGLYMANFIPTYFYEQKMQELDDSLAAVTKRVEAAKAEMAAKREIRKQMEQLNREEIELQRQLNAVNGLQRDRGLAFRTLDNLVANLPQKVWISKVTYANKTIGLEGSCWEYFPINDYVKFINESTQYSSVNFKGIRAENPQNKIPGVPSALQKIKVFDVEFNVKGVSDS